MTTINILVRATKILFRLNLALLDSGEFRLGTWISEEREIKGSKAEKSVFIPKIFPKIPQNLPQELPPLLSLATYYTQLLPHYLLTRKLQWQWK
ncbi:hypothetical protein CLV59_102566 [Chitinophaga dinghuensis]|uniref:Uncharacterized protein n=1 Tax=Chitinophaga dinghuensis TaxID=1539050 RepID=A0A327W765_9BACT|nr:hypothetical protein [Chitinophaga dinghuensis]RAJ85860.1 hypothetical protein CLV59_102566 [Chitinophaga dinghuensis]